MDFDLAMLEPRSVAPDTEALVTYFPVLSFGIVPINAFLIRSREPVLVDTGIAALSGDFTAQLHSLLPLRDLKWLWLTHTDADHIGSLKQVLAEAPDARVVTTFHGMGKMLLLQLPVDRVYLLNPGQDLDVGDRRLICVKPPVFDAPETTGLFDTKTKVLFCADCFGTLMKVPAEKAEEMDPADLRRGLITWTTIDVPWLPMVDEGRFRASLEAFRRLDPSVIVSSHLPPAKGMAETLLSHLAAAYSAPPFGFPDQAALMQILGAAFQV